MRLLAGEAKTSEKKKTQRRANIIIITAVNPFNSFQICFVTFVIF